MGRNQRKVAWAMYAFAAFLVATGLVDVTLKSKAGGVWIAAVAVVAVIVFRDMAQIELFDAGRLLNSVAHNAALASRRRIARAAVPFYVTFDVAALFGVFLFCSWILRTGIGRDALRVALPVRAFCTFVALFFFKTYVTVWSRAMLSNYVRLALACAFGTAASSALPISSVATTCGAMARIKNIRAFALSMPVSTSVFGPTSSWGRPLRHPAISPRSSATPTCVPWVDESRTKSRRSVVLPAPGGPMINAVFPCTVG